jgi:DNA-binding response OmpR family regulator
MNTRILIIEDNLELCNTLRDALGAHHSIFIAENALTALTFLSKHLPDLILLDIMLPFPMDGFALLKILKGESTLTNIPVILMSGLHEKDTVLEGLRIGANDFLVKPFKLNELIFKCQNLISISKNINHLEKLNVNTILAHSIENSPETVFSQKFELIVKDILLENQTESIFEIACKMQMSLSKLERLSKKVYGITPKQYVINLKLEKAKNMLIQKKGNVNEIAVSAGFKSVSYFCLCFKKRFGNSPKVYMHHQFLLNIVQ